MDYQQRPRPVSPQQNPNYVEPTTVNPVVAPNQQSQQIPVNVNRPVQQVPLQPQPVAYSQPQFNTQPQPQPQPTLVAQPQTMDPMRNRYAASPQQNLRYRNNMDYQQRPRPVSPQQNPNYVEPTTVNPVVAPNQQSQQIPVNVNRPVQQVPLQPQPVAYSQPQFNTQPQPQPQPTLVAQPQTMDPMRNRYAASKTEKVSVLSKVKTGFDNSNKLILAGVAAGLIMLIGAGTVVLNHNNSNGLATSANLIPAPNMSAPEKTKIQAEQELQSDQQFLTAYYASNSGYYPSALSASLLGKQNTTNFSASNFIPPTGYKFVYTVSPSLCGKEGDCTSYTLNGFNSSGQLIYGVRSSF